MTRVTVLAIVLAAAAVAATVSSASTPLFNDAQFHKVKQFWMSSTSGGSARFCSLVARRQAVSCGAAMSDGTLGLVAARTGSCGLKYQVMQNNNPYGGVQINKLFFC